MSPVGAFLCRRVLAIRPTASDYPAPPSNVSIDTAVVIDNGKFLETTVTWTAAKGKLAAFVNGLSRSSTARADASKHCEAMLSTSFQILRGRGSTCATAPSVSSANVTLAATSRRISARYVASRCPAPTVGGGWRKTVRRTAPVMNGPMMLLKRNWSTSGKLKHFFASITVIVNSQNCI